MGFNEGNVGPLAVEYPGKVAFNWSQVIGFLAFSHGWTFLFWFLGALTGSNIWRFPSLAFLILGGAGVVVGCVIMTWKVYGRQGLSDVGRRIVCVRLVQAHWWLAIVLLPPFLVLTSAAIAYIIGGVDVLNPQAALSNIGSPLTFVATLGFYLIIGPLPEEIGWRGYLLDRLEVRWSALTSSLFIGIVWWVWHLPLFLLPGYFENFGGAPTGPAGYLWFTVSGAILATWLYNNCNRSILAVIVFHLMGNLSGELLNPSEQVRMIQHFVTAAVIIGLLWKTSPRSFRLQRQELAR